MYQVQTFMICRQKIMNLHLAFRFVMLKTTLKLAWSKKLRLKMLQLFIYFLFGKYSVKICKVQKVNIFKSFRLISRKYGLASKILDTDGSTFFYLKSFTWRYFVTHYRSKHVHAIFL